LSKHKPNFSLTHPEPHQRNAKRVHAGERDQAYETPWPIVQAIERESGVPFDLDVAALPHNAKAPAYLPPPFGLRLPWFGRCWCNPPYEDQEAWIARAHWWAGQTGATTALLVLASTSALYWRRLVWERAAVDFYEGRVAFIDPSTGKPRPGFSLASALVWVGPEVVPGVVRVRDSVTGRLISRVSQ
jgi:phage N-6-adenine-methyltransferase